MSVVPVAELCYGLPYIIATELPHPLTLTTASLGIIAPALYVIVYIKSVFVA